MLFLEKGSRSFLHDRQLGCSLALVAGAVNVAGFLSVGSYCANMTGNVTAFAIGLQKGQAEVVLTCLALIVSFFAGAMLCTFLVNAGRRHGQKAIYAYSILLEGVLLASLDLVQLFWLPPSGHNVLPPLGLSFLMGLQNATVTRISGSVVRTTHVTGMITDLGIELADWFDALRHPVDPDQHARTVQRLRLHSKIIACFIGGGMSGAFGYTLWPAFFLLGVGLVLIALALPGILANARPETASGRSASE
ncbi:YoaK family protein [Acetobacter persici]|uniref:YoaK family protein n=1 Tax=Acetobacter persici TaxID=1076596 RepID=UPI001BAAB48F|nr:YoaK family protein [Acetobacter persici]MBS0963854.1 DUF1275 domain-containing protein [Acetobacter persici]